MTVPWCYQYFNYLAGVPVLRLQAPPPSCHEPSGVFTTPPKKKKKATRFSPGLLQSQLQWREKEEEEPGTGGERAGGRAVGRPGAGAHRGEEGRRQEGRRQRAGDRAGELAVRFAPRAHAAVCFVDGAFPDSPAEPSLAPRSLGRDVPPDPQPFVCWRRETSWYTHSVCWQSSHFWNRTLYCAKIL